MTSPEFHDYPSRHPLLHASVLSLMNMCHKKTKPPFSVLPFTDRVPYSYYTTNIATFDIPFSQDSSVGSTLDWYSEGPGSNLTVTN